MGWLIDISLWIAVERGALGAADIHAITRQEPIFLSPVNIAEIRFGLESLRPGFQKQPAAVAGLSQIEQPRLRQHEKHPCGSKQRRVLFEVDEVVHPR